jgi:proline racemase
MQGPLKAAAAQVIDASSGAILLEKIGREFMKYEIATLQLPAQLGRASSDCGLGVIFCQPAGTSNCSGETGAGSIAVVSIVISATVVNPASGAPD